MKFCKNSNSNLIHFNNYRFLRKLVYENAIPIDDLPIVFDYISQNPVGKYVTWNHISQNYQTFYNK